jgi:hypothetical protein
MPGARCTRSLACKKVTRELVTTVAPEHPAFPHPMVLTVSPSPRRYGFVRARLGRLRLRET